MDEILSRKFESEYYVHMFVEVRVKVKVSAGSQIEAVRKVIDNDDYAFSLHELFDHKIHGCSYMRRDLGFDETECTDNGMMEFLVDEVKDPCFSNSRWYKDEGDRIVQERG